MSKKHLTTPEILLLKYFYTRQCPFLTVKQASGILECSKEGARYQLEKLYQRGWVVKAHQFIAYYSPVTSAKMREHILSELNEVIY